MSYTESAPPIPKVPVSNYQYQDLTHTLKLHPHLFKIITPIKANNLETLLQLHPNQNLVKSVIDGLHHGFWPFTNTEDPKAVPQGIVSWTTGTPDLDDESTQFLRCQHNTEIQ